MRFTKNFLSSKGKKNGLLVCYHVTLLLYNYFYYIISILYQYYILGLDSDSALAGRSSFQSDMRVRVQACKAVSGSMSPVLSRVHVSCPVTVPAHPGVLFPAAVGGAVPCGPCLLPCLFHQQLLPSSLLLFLPCLDHNLEVIDPVRQ